MRNHLPRLAPAAVLLAAGLALFLTAGAEAATFFVHLTTDLPDCNLAESVCRSNCSLGGFLSCTLRAAIQEANDTAGPDEIVFLNVDPAGPETYTLTLTGAGEDAAATGDLDITGEVILRTDPGARPIIDGNSSDRVFHVLSGGIATLGRVTLQNATSNGKLRVDSGGEATLEHVLVTGSGSGLINAGVLAVTDSVVTGNSAMVGGGIHNSGTLTLDDSVVSGNSATNGGGGIYNFTGAAATLRDSTISGNTASGSGTANGGGIWSGSGSTLTLTNCTVSGNSAQDFGGGIQFSGTTLELNSVTIFDNTADSDDGGDGSGGGLSRSPAEGSTATAKNTLIAGNAAATALQADCQGNLTSQGYNLVGVDFCIFSPAAGDQLGTEAVPLDPLLDVLADNGGPGPMQTHALLPLSPARDAGNPAGCTDESDAILTTDQRGAPREMAGGGDGDCDIGAHEQGEVFADVPDGHPFRVPAEDLLFNGVTGGCAASPLAFCPAGPLLRRQMARLLLLADEGSDYAPPSCLSDPFDDVAAADPACVWIQELDSRGVAEGCDGANYCPDNPVLRKQLAVFLLRTVERSGLFPYVPPVCVEGSEMFADVPHDDPFCPWIEELGRRGAAGCGGGNYCPDDAVPRQQAALFLVACFGL